MKLTPENSQLMFYEQILRQNIYPALTGTQYREYSMKIGHNFLFSVLVKLGVVLLVK
jgi:hypothetical protein